MKTIWVGLSLLCAAPAAAQQPGMRGTHFDAEKYKVDMEARNMRASAIQSYTPPAAAYKYSEAPKKPRTDYRPPRYPSDTLVFLADKMICAYNGIYSSADSGLGDGYERAVPASDTLILTGNLKYKNGNVYSLNYNWYQRDASLKKHDYHSHKSTTCLLRKSGGSDKTFFAMDVVIERNGPQDSYCCYMNNNGEVRIDFFENGSKKGTIFKAKNSGWVKDGINGLTVLKSAEKLSFICNGQEIHSVILEHPWTRMFARLVVEYGVELTLYDYLHVFYPYN